MSELTVTDKVVVPNEVFGNLTVINGEQGMFFIGKEVATMLGYTNTRKAVRDHCKKAVSVGVVDGITGYKNGLIDTQTKIIPESDVYRLCQKSRLANSEELLHRIMKSVHGDNYKEHVSIGTSHEYAFGRDIVEKLFNGYEILPQFQLFGGAVKLDWYIPELKLAIEFDEEQHFVDGVLREECVERQKRVERELGCRFLRYKK